MLIGLGELSGPYALACAALGAFVGDGLSFQIGRRWGPQLRTHWPFRKFPQLLDRGETMFRRNALKSILIARYVGPIRPFVPAIAGMLKMPWRRYLPASALAAVSWAALFLVPGWVLGEAYDAVAAVAGRLALVLGLLLVVMALAWAMVLYTYRWFAAHADSLLARALAWSHEHPVLGRYSIAVFDPQRPRIGVAGLAGGDAACVRLDLVRASWRWCSAMANRWAWTWPSTASCRPCAIRWRTTRWRRWPRWAMPRCWLRPRCWCCCTWRGASAGWPRRTGWRRWRSASR